ncbi:transposase [Streptomyces sp. NPDC052051]|uniref:transposase n=1 Tax=Streptomyces sp. NPDC052051 TaxID=3154649 RepID=UPI00343D2F9E
MGPRPAARQFRLDQSVVGVGLSLTDAQWARIEPLLPDRAPRRGGRWRDHREVIDAIACEFQTGTPWVHLPEKYGNWQGVCNRARNLRGDPHGHLAPVVPPHQPCRAPQGPRPVRDRRQAR